MPLTRNDERGSLPDERLVRAYHNADYRVNGYTLKIAEPHPDFDRYLAESGVSYYVILTAYNPRSTPLAPAVNQARHRTLTALLHQRGQAVVAATGADPENNWEEERGYCLLDPDPTEAYEIGRIYEQHALVEGRRGGKPGLVWL